MKIAFILTHSSRGSSGSFGKTMNICKYLKNYGVEPTLFVPVPEDVTENSPIKVKLIPTFASNLNIANSLYRFSRKLANSKLTSKFFLTEKSIKKMINTIQKGVDIILTKNSFDAIYAIQSIAGCACGPLSKKFKIPLFLEQNNIWPEEAIIVNGINRNDKTFNLLKKIEQQSFDYADELIVVSELMKNYVRENYKVENKSISILSSAGSILPNSSFVRKSNVVYLGMVNSRSHVDLFAKSIPFIKKPQNIFISKYGGDIKNIKKIIITQKSDVDFFWFPKIIDLLNFLQKSKIGIVTTTNDITWQIGHPGKLFDYMSCGLPVIANNIDSWWTKMIKKEQIGLLSTDDPKDFAHLIDYLLSDEEMWSKMSNNARNLISILDYR